MSTEVRHPDVPLCPAGHGPMVQSNEPGGVIWACETCGRSGGKVDLVTDPEIIRAHFRRADAS
jgi:hypothetical protein